MRGKTVPKKAKKGLPVEMPTSLFLKKEMVAAAEKAVVYDLEKEFNEARKKRGFKLYLSLAVFSVLLLGGTFGVTTYIERQNRTIAIGIADFEDINMQELLYSLRNAGKLLADMQHNMDLMKGQMGREMERLRLKALADMELLRQKHNLTEAQRAALMKKIQEDRERHMAELNAEYKAKLKDKEKSIDDVKVQMGDYKVQLQQKTDAMVDKMETRLKDYQRESKENKAKAELMVKEMGENYQLKRQEEKKEYEKKLQDLVVKMKKAEETLKNTSDKSGDLEYLVAVYRKALTHYAFTRGEQGHVISVQKDGSLLVVLNPMVELLKSSKGLVIDNKGAVIARIQITPKGGMARAQVVQKLSKAPINPFDTIVVHKE